MEDNDLKPSILFVIASRTAGGIATVVQGMATELAGSEKYRVTLMCLHDQPQQVEWATHGPRIISMGWHGACAENFLDWLDDNRFDVIVTNDVSKVEGAFPYIEASTKHLAYLHDSQRRYREAILKNARWIDGVVAVADYIAQMLRPRLEAEGFPGLIEVIHNGAKFPPLLAMQKRNKEIRLLFMGSMDAIKGVQDLPPILGQLKKRNVSFTLDIVGGHSADIKHKLEKIGVAERVTWHGRVQNEECYEIASRADIFLMLSRREPFGMVTIEAMSMGCPVIGYDTPSGTSEIVIHGENGFLVPLMDYAGVSEMISHLASNQELLAKMSRSAASRARSEFDSSSMGKKLDRVLCNILHSKQKSERRRGRPSSVSGSEVRSVGPMRIYHQLPVSLRLVIRRLAYSNARIARWLSTR